MTQAEAYVELALWGIKLSQSASGLRRWWMDEAEHREQYGLSQEQIDVISDACREHIREMGELFKERPDEPITQKRRSKPRRGGAI
jgi:hypothetical protein